MRWIKIKFQLKRDGKKIPYQFHAKKIYKIPSYDMVVVETKENMAQKANVQPLKLATNQKIKSLKSRISLANTPLIKLQKIINFVLENE